MRSLKIVAIVAALIVIPAAAYAEALPDPAGPTFSCKPLVNGMLQSHSRVVAVTPTTVTFTNNKNTQTYRLEAKGGEATIKVIGGRDDRPTIIISEDLAVVPNQAASSIAGGKGILVRKAWGGYRNRFEVWSCTY